LNDLPPKIIQDYYCELSDLQKYLYDDFAKSKARTSAADTVNTASEGTGPGQQHVFQSLQYLRKLCNHPALVLKSNTEAIESAFIHLGNASTSLNEIQHAPKLLALKCVNIIFEVSIIFCLLSNTSGKFCKIVESVVRRLRPLIPTGQNCWTQPPKAPLRFLNTEF